MPQGKRFESLVVKGSPRWGRGKEGRRLSRKSWRGKLSKMAVGRADLLFSVLGVIAKPPIAQLGLV
jgi:hypothetical protein